MRSLRKRCYTALCGLAITVLTLGTPALANAHPPDNDWIFFLLMWCLFGGGQMGGGFPAGPGGCMPGGQPQPAPAPGAPAPNGNGQGAMLRNSPGAMMRAPGAANGGAALRPAAGQGSSDMLLRMLLGQRNRMPAIGQKPAPGGHGKGAAKPAAATGGKAGGFALPGGNKPAIGGKPHGAGGGKPGGAMNHLGKPLGGKPAGGRK